MSILSSSKCILLLSDDALGIYSANTSGVNHVTSFGWRMPDFEGEVAATLNRLVGNGSVYILNDGVEQHYRKEKINRLSTFDRATIINRRLNIAFPSYPTRAALQLKDKRKGAPITKENLFLFAAVPSTDSLRKLLEAISRADCTISSYCLLPIESVGLVDKIALKVAKENRQTQKSGWNILISQHQGGGLRQIVTRNGQIALTRITPVVLPDAENAVQWASEVVQEIQATISYLGRFGYSQNDGLEVILIGKPDFAALVEDMINIPCQFNSLTVQRAAEFAGISIGRRPDNVYSDALHIAWFQKKPTVSLSMRSKDMDSVAVPRKISFYVMLLLTCGLGYLAYNLSNEFLALYGAKENLYVVERMQVEANNKYDEEIKRKESLGIDIKLIQGSLGIFDEFQKQTFNPLPVLEIVGTELKDLRIDELQLDSTEPTLTATADPNVAPGQLSKQAVSSNILLKFSFPGTIKPEDGNARLQDLSDRLGKALGKEYVVSLSKQLADMTYKGKLTDATGYTAVKRSANERYTGEIKIQKDIVNAASTGAK